MKIKKVFTIIIGDVIGSRDISDRARLLKRIQAAISEIVKKFQEEFYAPLKLTRGVDELSGVLKRPEKAYQICTFLNERLLPYQFRFAIVRGNLDIGVKSKDAAKMDGTAFHIAANIIERARKEKRCYYFDLGLQPPILEQLVNELSNLIYLLRSNWSNHQRRIVELYLRLGSQQSVAKKLSITQQAVSDALRQARWKEIGQAEKVIELLLKDQR